MNFLRTIFAFLILAGPASQAEAETTVQLSSKPAPVSIRHELRSDLLGRSLFIYISLPQNYSDSNKTYPTIYLLDGGITFPLLSSYHRYLRFGDETPEAILVGISYDADTFEEGNMRATDYSAPSDERDYWGGAESFQNVLKTELFPLVENLYRSDPSKRIIFGQSMGGQFVLFNALTEPDLFAGHIASNPALHRNLPFFLEWHGQQAITGPVSKLYVSNGELNDQRFQVPALKWVEHWQTQAIKPWALHTKILPEQTHFSAAPESFRQGLQWLEKQQD